MARPTDCTPETIEEIYNYVRMGMSYSDSARLSGITYRTLRNWSIWGEEESENRQLDIIDETKEPYVQFFHRVKKAKLEGKAEKVRLILEIAKGGKRYTETKTRKNGDGETIETITTVKETKGDWQALMTLLERQFPEEYSRRTNLQFDWKKDLPEGVDDPELLIAEISKLLEAGEISDDE